MEAVSSLNEKQRQIYDLFMEKYRQILQGTENNNQLLVNIDGEGGSGKSYLIKLLSDQSGKWQSIVSLPSGTNCNQG